MVKLDIEQWKIMAWMLAVYDAVALNAGYFLALLLRFDFQYSRIPADYLANWESYTPVYTVLSLLIFYGLRLYHSLWRFASFSELLRIIYGNLATILLMAVGMNFFVGNMPISYYIMGAAIQFGLVLGVRFAYRFILLLRVAQQDRRGEGSRVMLIGAGSAGQLIMRDIKRSVRTNEKVCCFIDDDPTKWNRLVDGVPIVGGRDEILASVEKYQIDKIYLTVPSASAAEKRDLLNICKETDCELKQLPGLYQLVNGQLSVSAMKKVSVEDLLGREPVKADLSDVFQFIHGKRVLVTGGGGSIGSELARQIAAHQPEQLILVDIYENNVYNVQLELRDRYPELDLVVLIASVRDSRRMFQIFEEYRPQIVYHAAAHKHVPLMEDSPCEAVKNNAIGTFKTAYAAMVHGCERFVLISTDKAVNPTNIMGATKRLCEMIIQSFDAKIKAGKANEIPQLFTHEGLENADADGTGKIFENVKTEFVAVRFGNVLGSNGSVIPIFQKQIAAGHNLTVTHPDIIRYFMTIPEAVSLVMLAGTYAKGGEIFVLDMGSPVKIADLAKNLIRLSGLKLGVDIDIDYTGLRPGEKLFEEKLMAEEGLKKTENDLIHIGCPIPFDTEEFLEELDELMVSAYKNKNDIRVRVKAMVSTYHPAENIS
ncbi:putative capsular polysaccharide biosynthesis protein [Selenomonas ruminantium subsp. lactilytica TAM6421]|uniref:Putative capsular polysaccharide biosynthesis protein n=1 Tax=Selenomonas ruminantium subsp. lactilytica (strain NBRC 103574 / TAM6421) TaxID=927704 RepID=I0GRR1_SELRL|nr:nucleoside-diphosphate sugar epimerase/dehydratase [Selenomonas ruminantium]BAL83448.1 putative capsular polysaccharide biosynthesis protein [Selenomonas ruminantium subsp. lactilytica TAM6421]